MTEYPLKPFTKKLEKLCIDDEDLNVVIIQHFIYLLKKLTHVIFNFHFGFLY